MSNPYARTRAALKAEIVRRIASGEPQRALDRDPAMPAAVTIWKWRRADPGFDAEMAKALKRGAWSRSWRFDAAKAKAFLTRLAAGERVAHILRDPAMPSRKVYTHWRATQMGFADDVARIQRNRRDWWMRGLRRVKVPRAFDREVADEIIRRVGRGEMLTRLCKSPDFPCWEVLARWRREDEDFRMGLKVAVRVGRARRCRDRCAAQTDAILARIVEGRSLEELSREPGMPHATTLKR